ncbi:universal stress protein [Paracoccaceae bacterium GXU_MW_L88]
MYQTILAAIDGSSHSDRVLDHAIALTKTCGAKLHIMTVYRHHSPSESSLSMIRSKDLETPESALKSYAKEVAEYGAGKAKDAGVTAKTHAVRGAPSRKIVDQAKKLDADLIILGKRGLGDMGGFLLGGVSHKVTSLAPCACLTVK